MNTATVHLGFEVGTGAPVEVPLAHTFVSGQTQLSGKTTALRALVERSGQRALAFVTKRGETFEGRRIRPYLPREGEQPIHWRLVETILASALGQRSMKYERLWLINAVKRPAIATTLAMVRGNVAALFAKAKGNSADVYTLIGEYLDLVLPDMRALDASDALDLQPGLNVMDLVGVSQQLQALVIRAALEHINRHEEGVLTVFPEAWEFAPRSSSAPAKEEAIAMARKGAVLRNFLLCDSQDLAGVDTVIRQAASVWLLGVQRELNELKRTLRMIPAGVKRPKAEDVAQLELGQFYACWGRHAVKVYVQPAWMLAPVARAVARGEKSLADVKPYALAGRPKLKEETVNAAEAQALREENSQLRKDNEDLRRRVASIEGERSSRSDHRPDRPVARPGVQGHGNDVDAAHRTAVRPDAAAAPSRPDRASGHPHFSEESENLYQAIKARLIDEAAADPQLLRVLVDRPELEVRVRRATIEVDGDSLRGRLAQLIAEGFFDTGMSAPAAQKELARRGNDPGPANTYKELDSLAVLGFLTIEQGRDDRGRPRKEYRAVAGMKPRIVEAA